MLPIIDISELPTPSARVRVAKEIASATKHSGFFYIQGHGIPADSIKNLRQQQRAFFGLPLAQKNDIAINEFNRGYLGFGKAKMHGAKTHDQKEVFFWGAELPPDHYDIVNRTPLCGPNLWPTDNNFRKSILDYSYQIKKTGNKLLQCVAIALGAEHDFFEPYYAEPMLRGQLIHYPPTSNEVDSFGVAEHSDFGCLTLLLQETDGLEVLQHDKWIAAPVIAGTLVVNIGDLLERWSNKRMPSTRHRVRNLSNKARYSIAMFHDPSPNAVVDPADINPQLKQYSWEGIKAADYILGRNKGAFSHYGNVEEATRD